MLALLVGTLKQQMMNNQTLSQIYEMIKKANESQTRRLTEVQEKQTLLKEEMKINLQEIHDKIGVNKIEITNLNSRFIGLERAGNKLIINGEKYSVEKLKELEEQSETDIEAEEDLNDQSEET
ncbi:hypothetical protein JTB14_009992 [Gonioctena quinquepunctata]|nr:hypothetical protein JTB14_009992 [Gonioctena quinquepunctata]